MAGKAKAKSGKGVKVEAAAAKAAPPSLGEGGAKTGKGAAGTKAKAPPVERVVVPYLAAGVSVSRCSLGGEAFVRVGFDADELPEGASFALCFADALLLSEALARAARR